MSHLRVLADNIAQEVNATFDTRIGRWRITPVAALVESVEGGGSTIEIAMIDFTNRLQELHRRIEQRRLEKIRRPR